MVNLNKVQLMGHVGKDVELRYTPSGTAVARFSMATSENRKDAKGEWTQETTWHNIIVWGTLAERVAEKVKKGNQIYVEGKISVRNWEDKEGQKRTNYEIVAWVVQSNEKSTNGNGQTNGGTTQPVMDEDLPF